MISRHFLKCANSIVCSSFRTVAMRALAGADRVKQNNTPHSNDNWDGANSPSFSTFAATAAVATVALLTTPTAFVAGKEIGAPALDVGSSRPAVVWPPVGGTFDPVCIDEYKYVRDKEGKVMKDVDLIAAMKFQKAWAVVRLETDGDEDEEEAEVPSSQAKVRPSGR